MLIQQSVRFILWFPPGSPFNKSPTSADDRKRKGESGIQIKRQALPFVGVR